MEHSMIQLEKKRDFNAGNIVCRGVSERLNYIPIEGCLYDLTFSLPFKFFDNIQISNKAFYKMNLNEKKLSRFNKEYLDISENNKMYMSYSYLDLCYMKALQNLNQDSLDSQHVLL